jgi:hypothetical protein
MLRTADPPNRRHDGISPRETFSTAPRRITAFGAESEASDLPGN